MLTMLLVVVLGQGPSIDIQVIEPQPPVVREYRIPLPTTYYGGYSGYTYSAPQVFETAPVLAAPLYPVMAVPVREYTIKTRTRIRERHRFRGNVPVMLLSPY